MVIIISSISTPLNDFISPPSPKNLSHKDLKKEIEILKTEVAGLKIRLKRIEEYFLDLPNAKDYIHEDDSKDQLFEEAKNVVSSYDRVSASLLQRRLGIGYSRAARLLNQLEEEGILGPAEGGKPRDVIKKQN